jgi:hypothetical protein
MLYGINNNSVRFDEDNWEDLRFPATAINPPGAATAPTYDTTNIGYSFSASLTNVLGIIAQLPHSWKTGTSIYPHIHWMPTNTNTGDVLWRMEYKWTNIMDTDSGSWTTLDKLSAGGGTAYKHQMASFDVIDGTGKTISSIITIKLSRIGGDGSDTYNANALLKEFDIHYRQDGVGSDEEKSKSF